MRNMDGLPLDSGRLSYRSGGYRYVLSVDDDHLTVDCQRPTYSKVTKTRLKGLRPELTTERWMPDSARRRGTEARYLLAAAVVVFFSDVQKYIPLLAPMCVVLAGTAMYRAIQASWPLTKTVIRTDDEDYVASIPHIGSLEVRRKAFEDTLLRFIRAARNEDLSSREDR